ncbi:hypothetical protein CKA32_002980 [Geitlerinema sp. FC II]|nr:hypothetical protein CKA32_002980 [Geitlerinema sp. FC II]
MAYFAHTLDFLIINNTHKNPTKKKRRNRAAASIEPEKLLNLN